MPRWHLDTGGRKLYALLGALNSECIVTNPGPPAKNPTCLTMSKTTANKTFMICVRLLPVREVLHWQQGLSVVIMHIDHHSQWMLW